ncbi:large exoprotein [Microbacterium sp. RD1]|uniref:large exoprotein n=1 Tax=Microbacterium sp. RD1 TaxID=3457313 RepID=UPI003FA574BC
MGGQVLGGGVIVAVAVVLWLVYLLPSWHSRYQYTSAERNAVRLNQALRVLAETSETPREVQLELNARTALAQQRLARRAQAEREQAELEIARAELEIAKEQSAADRELARAHRAETIAAARAQREAARRAPEARRARARRRMRLTTTVVAVAALAAVGVGAWQMVLGASAVLIWAGAIAFVACVVTLHRMSRVAARAVVRAPVEAVAPAAVPLPDVVLERPRAAGWTPRELPRPLASSAGSRAAAVLDERDAREALRVAAREEALRGLAAQNAPPSIDTARTARASEFSRMGYVDDAEIEAHVRQLLARRAVGE